MSVSTNHTYVQYFIPYDGDKEEFPNVFLVRSKNVTLGDVIKGFPLPGQYFFRAKQTFGKTYIWLDLHDPAEEIPLFNNKIILKVSRINAGPQTISAAPSVVTSRAAAPVSTPAPAPAPTPAPATRLSASSSAPASVPKVVFAPSPAPAVSNSDDFMGFFNSPASQQSVPVTPAAATPQHDPFGLSSLYSSSPAPAPAVTSSSDPFGTVGNAGAKVGAKVTLGGRPIATSQAKVGSYTDFNSFSM